jgi:NAD(P)-dependent dehydrogenase (short-subunit alcohol dehydrogenase family)
MTRTCIITGVASGIGAATAALLRAEGWSVEGWDIRPPADGSPWREVDVTSETMVAQAWKSLDEDRAIEGLVNAAGIWRTEPFEAITLADWRKTFSINVEGTVLMCSEAVKRMRHTGGSIVNFSSLAALRPPKIPSAPYAASKGAITSFTRALAAEIGRYGVRVNCVAPGAIETPMLVNVLSPEQISAYSGQSSLGRLGRPDEIASLVAYLLSDAASLVHGACIEAPGA